MSQKNRSSVVHALVVHTSAVHAPTVRARARSLAGRLLSAGAALLLPSVAFAATLPVQGTLRTPGGGPVADGAYVAVVALYDAPGAAKPVWQELQKKVVVSGGFFAFDLGSATPIDDKLLLAGTPLWVGLQIGGDDELARVPMGGVPRAWHAAMAAGLDCSGCVTGTHLATGAVGSQHVAFSFAGSASKGGPADEALHAKTADTAKNADFAAAADTAKSAGFANAAKQADSAASAEELKCSGCVGLKQLAPDVANGFVSTKGGTIDGKLAVTQGLDLGASLIGGGRFEAVDVAKSACGAPELGRISVDAANKRLYFCDGTKFRKLQWCTGECKAQVVVPCGQALVDDCGDPGTCTGKGTLCAPGEVCDSDKCTGLGETAESAVASCKVLLGAKPGTADGSYWVDPDGAGPKPAQKLPCDMKGGGWTRVAYDDFEASAAGWTPGPVTSCGAWGKVLGGYAKFGGGAVTAKTFGDLPAHTAARVDAVWVRLDSWDGEEARMKIDGQQVWSKVGVHTGGDGHVCGADNGWKDELFQAKGELAHANATLEVQFSSTLDQDPSDESWAVDNVAVWVK
ncbi:MAG: hypothetical protein EXR79_00730 [Myxococcales bacterium]|nr:hypothetical protein [Myxococcales bacterium]